MERSAASLLDPLVVERRLFEIDVMSRTDFATYKDYVRAIKSAIYRLRQLLGRSFALGGGSVTEPTSAATTTERWADELNQLAMAVETLAKIKPTTNAELEAAWRKSAFDTARAVRERIAELIPE